MKFINDNALRDLVVILFQRFGKDGLGKKIDELEKKVDELAAKLEPSAPKRRGRPPKNG